jgi:hypothetical protein
MPLKNDYKKWPDICLTCPQAAGRPHQALTLPWVIFGNGGDHQSGVIWQRLCWLAACVSLTPALGRHARFCGCLGFSPRSKQWRQIHRTPLRPLRTPGYLLPGVA